MKEIKEFYLGAIKWNVKIDHDRLMDLDSNGYCEYDKSLITLDNEIKTNLLPEQVFYHEIVHAILDTIGEYELSKNEKFVQNFSLMLHQFEKTKK